MKKVVKLSNILNKLDDGYANELKQAVKSENLDIDDLEVYRKDYAVETKASLEEGSRTVIKYVSTRTVDQVGDVVMPKGLSFKQFKKTGMPVFYNHNYSMPQIGRDEWVKADEYGVKVKMKYADLGEGTLADILWKLTSQDMNKQSSIGLIPLEVIRETDDEFKSAVRTLAKEWPEFRATQKACRRIITKAICFEHSDCSMACNTDTDVIAVSKAFQEAGADEKILKQLGMPIPVTDADLSYTVDAEEVVVVETKEAEHNDLDFGEDADTEEVVEAVEAVEEVKEEEVKVEEVEEVEAVVEEEVIEEKVEKKKVTMVKQPRIVKLIQGPSVSKEEFNDMVQKELRRKMGRLL